jgi:anti-sigma factor RsiW
MNCQEARNLIHCYLDDEMPALQVAQFESHLLDCDGCRDEHRRWQEVVDVVRGSTKAYGTSLASAARAEQLVTQTGTRRAWNLQLLAAGIGLTILGAAAAWFTGALSGGESFRRYAAESHLRYSRGGLGLDVSSDDPAVLSAWLDQNLPFHLQVPAYPNALPAEKAYRLVGARLLRDDEDDVAFLSYTMNDSPVSLLVASAEGREPNGGELYRSAGLAFHFHSVDGLKLISWVDKGLSYVIVSDVAAAGAQSCIVCHGHVDEQPKFERLKPLTDSRL